MSNIGDGGFIGTVVKKKSVFTSESDLRRVEE